MLYFFYNNDNNNNIKKMSRINQRINQIVVKN